MGNDKKTDNAGRGILNVLITIISVLVYVAYSLIKGFARGIGKFKKSAAPSIIGVIIIIVLAIVFWPVTLAASGALLVLLFLLAGYGVIDL